MTKRGSRRRNRGTSKCEVEKGPSIVFCQLEHHDIYFHLNRIRTSFRTISWPPGTKSLDSFYNTILSLERGIYNTKPEDNFGKLEASLSNARVLLNQLVKHGRQADGEPLAESIHSIILILSDLHIVETRLELLRHPCDNLDQEDELSQFQQSQVKASIKQRRREFSGKQPLAIDSSEVSNSIRRYDQLIIDGSFEQLTDDLDLSAKGFLASILACEEQLVKELGKLRASLLTVNKLTPPHTNTNFTRLRFLMGLLDQEISDFVYFYNTFLMPSLALAKLEFPAFQHFDFPGMSKDNSTTCINASNYACGPVEHSTLDSKVPVEFSSVLSKVSDSAPAGESSPDESELDDLADFMEPTVESAEMTAPPPPEFLKELERLCKDHSVKEPMWSMSTLRKNQVIVNCKGITEDTKDILQNKMKREYPDFDTEFVVIELSTQNLAGVVRQRSCNKTRENVEWADRETSRCEILLTGLQPHKNNRRAIYAVTSAHLLLYKEEMCDIENADDFQQQELKLNYYRSEVNKRIGEFVYIFQSHGHFQSIDLCNPPLLGFRTCKHPEDNDKDCDLRAYDHMSDIALIPIEQNSSQSVNDLVHQSSEIHLTAAIRHLSESDLNKFVELSCKVYAKGREGVVVMPKKEVFEVTQKPRAISLPFTLTEGDPFRPGDSGSLIYI